jgi:L-ascorbate metabolism protein UlaG (beta-lactamase superfamily)
MRVTWWGHSTVTISLDGMRLLTDPALTGQVAHLRRRRGPLPRLEARRADAVLVSHLHADHLHLPSLRLVDARARLLLPGGASSLLRGRTGLGLADRATWMQVGSSVAVGGVRVTAVPAAHDGRRTTVSRISGPALGYLLEGSARVWFAGDTDLHDAMEDLRPVDVALVPVGGWGPTLGPGHMDPLRAAEAVRRVEARVAIPIHYGTLWPRGLTRVSPERFLGPERAFAEHAARIAPGTEVVVLAPGGRWQAAGTGPQR